MDQALTNIRNRVDAFGVGEPDIVLSGNTIEVQIPGLTNGTIEERQKEQYCLVDDAGVNYGCGADQAEAQAALDDLQVTSQASEACVEDADGTQLECFTSEQEATAFQSSITVAAKTAASPSASPSGSASPSASPSSEPDTGGFCLTDPTGKQYGCSPTKKEAQKVVDGLTVEVTKQQLLRHRRRHRHRIGGLAHPVGHARSFEVRLAVAQRVGLTQRQPLRERGVRPRSARDGDPPV